MAERIPPEIGAPMTVESTVAVMKPAVALARSRWGYQQVR